METINAIEVKGLWAAYEDRMIIEDMNLKIPKGKITIIIGANGCGKSTLLKVISRILPAKRGEVRIDGMDIRKEKAEHIAKKVAVLPQTPTCPDAITVRELVSYGRFPYRKAIGGMSRHDIEQVDWALEKTGLTEISGRLVTELSGGQRQRDIDALSGGQRQRAWIAMTLAQETEMILLDEPTTYLDMAYQLDVLQLLERMNREKQLRIVMVLHDLNEACRFADHIIGLKNGKVVCEGRPADVITRENIREIYGIDAKLVMSDGGYPICMEFDRVIKTL